MMNKEKIMEGVKLILEGIGEDVNREGLIETPDRIARMYMEIFEGLGKDAKEVLSKTFSVENNDLVLEKDITFFSMCEHHLVPFFGKAHIAYIPKGKVAEVITQAWGMPVTKIDLSNAETDYSSFRLEKEDIAIIAVPSYGGRVPSLAAQRISNIHGNHMPCVIVCVYGNRAYEDTLIELNDVVEKSGFKVIAAIAAIAEHSIMHQYAAGRPDTKDRSELSSFVKKVLEKIYCRAWP